MRFANLTRVTGGWTILDSTVSLSSRMVRYGSSGWPNGAQTDTKYPTDNFYDYTTPATWAAISLTGSYTFGTNSTVTLKRGTSSTWTLYLLNNL